MTRIARGSFFVGTLFALMSLLLQLKATTGAWVGVPCKIDQVYYKYSWMSSWSFGLACVAVTLFVYGLLLRKPSAKS